MRRLFIALQVAVGIALVAAAYAGRIDPNRFAPAAVGGLAYPVLLLVSVVVAVPALLRRSRLVWLTLAFILLTWPALRATIVFKPGAHALDEISIMTWNVKNFDLYNWSHNDSTRALMLELIRTHDPDILCFQEFYTSEKRGGFDNAGALRRDLGYPHHHVEELFTKQGARHWGIATFSRLPIASSAGHGFETGRINGFVRTAIAVDDSTRLDLFNVHLQSNHFDHDDLAFLDRPDLDEGAGVRSSRTILGKILDGAQRRVHQALDVRGHIAEAENPVVVVGDMNDSPLSYAHHLLADGLEDAWTARGWGRGTTYESRWLDIRIDRVLGGPGVRFLRIERIPQDLSDHHPILVHLTVQDPAP